MKTAKPPAPEGAGGSSRRAQPVRQTRINPPRTSSLNRANSFASAPAQEQPIDILPGVTHFADAITALPKELVRHFTLLKEVDAKIFAPEAALFQLLHDALNTPLPDLARPLNDASSSVASVSAPMSAPGSTTGASNPPPPPSNDGSAVFDPANIPRRTLFRDTALKIQEMLVSLEEKNHVIATANDALQKQLGRIEELWPHLEGEFSDEAKWGSTTHWAYVENRQAKANDKQAERSRREGAATLSAAAQQLAEEAAARSSDRKQAMAAKKNSKNQAAEADAEKTQDAGRKTQGGGKRKPLPDGTAAVGLGITSAPPGSGNAPSKRRKVETTKSNGGTPTDRAMSTVFGNNTSKPKTTSPRATPAPESGNKKRKALPTSSNQAKKRTNAAMSPSVTSSPVIGTFPDPVKVGRDSPVPSAAPPRPATSRARQNSIQSSIENGRQRPASVAPNKPNGNSPGTPDPNQQSNGTKTNTDSKAHKETVVPVPSKPHTVKPENEETLHPAPEPAQNGSGSNKESVATKPSEEREPLKKELAATLAIQPSPVSSAVKTTKSGRASKPSTPALATFAEAASLSSTTTTSVTTTSSRSRPSRNNADAASTGSANTTTAAGTTNVTATTTTATKRSHKKGASISASAAAAATALATTAATSTTTSTTTATSTSTAAASTAAEKEKEKDKERERDKMPAASGGSANNNAKRGVDADVDDEDEDDEQDENEPVYCYCNQVSYGEMVACDGEGCPREWFHLGCVGLKIAPKGNAKWYCEDCKKRLKGGGGERR
ncbi:Chromatin modification-related protein [Madurella fahalii]|uniref:Chromatin modification-related protein n=1 Tax=Madurella fahalii TaxID=1157608 RepID=A0ABQ0G7D6_9PEZI